MLWKTLSVGQRVRTLEPFPIGNEELPAGLTGVITQKHPTCLIVHMDGDIPLLSYWKNDLLIDNPEQVGDGELDSIEIIEPVPVPSPVAVANREIVPGDVVEFFGHDQFGSCVEKGFVAERSISNLTHQRRVRVVKRREETRDMCAGVWIDMADVLIGLADPK